MRSELVFVRHQSSHHALHSGYQQIAEGMPVAIIGPTVDSRLPWRVRNLLAGWARHANSTYSTTSASREVQVLQHMRHNRGGIIHFLHGERDVFYIPYLKNLFNYAVVATVHSPPTKLYDTVNPKVFKRLDGIFCVGTNQAQSLQGALGSNRIWFVPHGVDTEYFSPSGRVVRNSRCLFVGQHLRDFDLLDKVATRLSELVSDFELVAVVRSEFQERLPQGQWCLVKSDIPDEVLRDYYRSSALLLLPLKDVTAANSILEALACGLPVVTNDVGAVRDYVNERCALLCPAGDVEGLTEATMQLLRDQQLNDHMRLAARQQALKFAWANVREQLLSIYRSELGFRPR